MTITHGSEVRRRGAYKASTSVTVHPTCVPATSQALPQQHNGSAPVSCPDPSTSGPANVLPYCELHNSSRLSKDRTGRSAAGFAAE
jgi:hypothetical protein